MAFSNVVTFVQNKISSYMPEITEERAFAAKWAMTTIALETFDRYAPYTFLLSSLTLIYGHITLFNKAIREWDPSRHNSVKNWMITACVVGSASFTITALRSVMFLPSALEFLTKRSINLSLFNFTLFSIGVGHFGTIAHGFYQRGLELMKTATWEPMQAHMQNNDARKKVESFGDKIGFCLGLTTLNIFEGQIAHIQELILQFVPEKQREQRFKELTDQVVNEYPFQDPRLEIGILLRFKSFCLEKQLQSLPRLIEALGYEVLAPFNGEPLHTAFLQRRDAIEQNHLNFYDECEWEANTLYAQIDTMENDAPLTEISSTLESLKSKINQYCEDIKLYHPDKEDLLKKFQLFQKQWASDLRIKKLERLNFQKRAANGINLNHETDDYLLIKYEGMERGSGELFLDALCARLNVSGEELFNKLSELKIGTIGEFVEKVLGGDEDVLGDKGAVLAKLNAFYSKGRLYTILAYGSDLATLAGKITYKAVILLAAIAPMFFFPPATIAGIVMGIFLDRTAPLFRNLDFWMEETTPFGIRRPFFTLITDTHPEEMAEFASADLLKKTRILAEEVLIRYVIPMITFGFVGLGFVRGVDIGQETVKKIRSSLVFS